MCENWKQIAGVTLLIAILGLGAGTQVFAQQAQPGQPPVQQVQPGPAEDQPPTAQNPNTQNGQQQPQQLPPDTVRPNYVLGPNDQVQIGAPEAPEISNRPFRIDGDGNINLPLV